MTLKKIELKKEKGRLDGWITGVAIGRSIRTAVLKMAMRFFGQDADAGDSNLIDHISISEYSKSQRFFDSNSKLKILMVFVLFLVNLATPAVSTITSGPDDSQMNFNFYSLDDDDDNSTKGLVDNSLFIFNPSLMECFKESSKNPFDCELGIGKSVNNVKSISVFIENNATEGYKTSAYFNKANHNNIWDSNNRFNLYCSKSKNDLSHELEG
jgi:hypothetical protein